MFRILLLLTITISCNDCFPIQLYYGRNCHYGFYKPMIYCHNEFHPVYPHYRRHHLSFPHYHRYCYIQYRPLMYYRPEEGPPSGCPCTYDYQYPPYYRCCNSICKILPDATTTNNISSTTISIPTTALAPSEAITTSSDTIPVTSTVENETGTQPTVMTKEFTSPASSATTTTNNISSTTINIPTTPLAPSEAITDSSDTLPVTSAVKKENGTEPAVTTVEFTSLASSATQAPLDEEGSGDYDDDYVVYDEPEMV